MILDVRHISLSAQQAASDAYGVTYPAVGITGMKSARSQTGSLSGEQVANDP